MVRVVMGPGFLQMLWKTSLLVGSGISRAMAELCDVYVGKSGLTKINLVVVD